MKVDFNIMDYAPGNASETDSETTDFPLAIPGKYKCEIIDSTEEISAAGNRYLKLKLSICDGGQFNGTWIWDNLNINHPTEKVRARARLTLGIITKAVGLVGIDDTSELHYKPLTIELESEPAKGDYKAKNVVRK